MIFAGKERNPGEKKKLNKRCFELWEF